MRPWLVLTLVALVGGVPVAGHHSFAAKYFEERTVSMEGDLVRFEFRNPHAWVYIMAPDDRGQLREYRWGVVQREAPGQPGNHEKYPSTRRSADRHRQSRAECFRLLGARQEARTSR